MERTLSTGEGPSEHSRCVPLARQRSSRAHTFWLFLVFCSSPGLLVIIIIRKNERTLQRNRVFPPCTLYRRNFLRQYRVSHRTSAQIVGVFSVNILFSVNCEVGRALLSPEIEVDQRFFPLECSWSEKPPNSTSVSLRIVVVAPSLSIR